MALLPYQLELLSPAKNADIGIEAINHGADAVYIGGPGFGARASAGNSLKDIERLCRHAHRFNSQIFITLNTILRDDELEGARQLAWDVYRAGADVLIVQDMALLEMDLPPIQLHASTQTDIRTVEKARFLQEVGFSQIVLARELTLEQIAEIRRAFLDCGVIFLRKFARPPTPAVAALSFSFTVPCAWPTAASALSATPIPGAVPTGVIAHRPAACPIT